MDQTALDLPVAPKTLAKPRVGLFASQLTLYICIVLLAAFASYAYWLKTRSIFACQAPGYSADRYLAYCGGGNYADFEHGAFFYNLEPPALDYARNADVLVLGNSRLQVALVQRCDGRLVQAGEGALLPAGVQLQRGHGFHR